jgi:hypothetical protein
MAAYKYVNGELVILTQEEIDEIDVAREEKLSEVKNRAIEIAKNLYQAKINSNFVSVTTSAGTHDYGIDPDTQTNIRSVLLGVALGVTPNPRPWTPKGETVSVSLTHADLTLVGVMMMQAVDSYVQSYLTHKAAILSLTTVAAVEQYDMTSGWPDSGN